MVLSSLFGTGRRPGEGTGTRRTKVVGFRAAGGRGIAARGRLATARVYSFERSGHVRFRWRT
jgi:hypothetical protein